MNQEVVKIQEGGKRKSARKASRKGSRKSSKASRKSSRRSVSRKSSRKASRKSSRKASRKASKKTSRKSSRRSVSRKSSKKVSRKSSKKASRKSSKKARREANPQISVRGAAVKYLWSGVLDIKKIATELGVAQVGVPAKIVNFAFQEAMKQHPMSESDKKSAAFWNGVQKTVMGLLKNNLNKYVAMLKK